MDHSKLNTETSKQRILYELEEEFQNIYLYCNDRKLSAKCFDKMNEPLKTYLRNRNKWGRRFIWGVLIVLIVSVLLSIETLSWQVTAVTRIVLIKCLTIWDWTSLHNTPCLIKALNDPGERVLPPATNCDLCESLENIGRQDSIDAHLLLDRYIKVHEPVIVQFPGDYQQIDYLNLLFQYNNFLDSIPCDLSTNLINSKRILAEKLIDRALSNVIPNWFFHFRNCELQAVKSIRLLSPHLAFLPYSIPRTHTNWLIMSSHYSFKTMKILNVDQNVLILFVQLQGEFHIELIPRTECTVCNTLSVTLHENDCLVFISSIWSLGYMPNNNSSSVAILEEIYWEQN